VPFLYPVRVVRSFKRVPEESSALPMATLGGR